MPGTLIEILPSGLAQYHPWTKRGSPNFQTIKNLVTSWYTSCRVKFEDKVREAYVSDNGYAERLEVNPVATYLYHQACIPGTTHRIVGPMVIWLPTIIRERVPFNEILLYRVSGASGKLHSMRLKTLREAYEGWWEGKSLDTVPNLTISEREFLLTGTTEEEWKALFSEEEEV